MPLTKLFRKQDEMAHPTFRIGPIRPPSEANSLLLQVTQGCTWNRCKFCELYKNQKFRAFSADSIKEDIDAIVYYAEKAKPYFNEDGTRDDAGLRRALATTSGDAQQCFYMVVNWLAHGGEHVFLQDGNTLALQNGRLADVLNYLKQAFPKINRITSYGRAESLSGISLDSYKELRAAGLTRIHSGFESGSDKVLAYIDKGTTSAEQILAGRNIKEAGIELSVYFMPGVGGKALSQENARGMAHVVSEIDPDFLRIRTAAIKENTKLHEEWQAGTFQLCSDDDKVLELQTLIRDAHGESTMVASDHIINLLPLLEGKLNADKPKLLGIIDEYLALTPIDRRIYQLLRRNNVMESVADLKGLGEADYQRFVDMCRQIPDETQWTKQMNMLIARYV